MIHHTDTQGHPFALGVSRTLPSPARFAIGTRLFPQPQHAIPQLLLCFLVTELTGEGEGLLIMGHRPLDVPKLLIHTAHVAQDEPFVVPKSALLGDLERLLEGP